MTEAFPDTNPWAQEPIRDYVEMEGTAYRNVCPICWCTTLTFFMEKHLAWHEKQNR